MKQLWTTKQLAKHFQVSEVTIWRWRGEGMPCKQVGTRTIRFDFNEVNKWHEQKKTQRIQASE